MTLNKAMTTDEILLSREFNQMLGQALVKAANEEKAKQYKRIAEAGYDMAIAKMNDFGANDLSVVYTRRFLEDINGLYSEDDLSDEAFDRDEQYGREMNDRRNFHSSGKNDPHRGYTMEFLSKWYTVRF